MIGLAALAAGCTTPVQESPRRSRADVFLPTDVETITSRVPRHATLDSLLRSHELAVELVDAAVKSAAGVFNPRNLRAERPYRLVRSLDGVLREFEYQIDADNFLRIFNPDHRRPGELRAAVVPIEKETQLAAVSGAIGGERAR